MYVVERHGVSTKRRKVFKKYLACSNIYCKTVDSAATDEERDKILVIKQFCQIAFALIW